MRNRSRRLGLSVAAMLAVTLAVGVVAASAHGPGGRGLGDGAGVSSLVTQAATQLGIARTSLVSAIQQSAGRRIAQAVTDGDVTSTQGSDLTTEAQDDLNVAYRLSETATVASNLGITTSALDTGFAAARKAAAEARVAAALAAGRITSAQATTLTTQIDARTFPGYKNGLGRGGGLGLRLGRGLGSLAGPTGGTFVRRGGGAGLGLGHGARHQGRH